MGGLKNPPGGSFLRRLDQRVSLKIVRPRRFEIAYAAILFAILCVLAEVAARAPFVQARIPYQAYGMNHTQLELQINLLDKFVREKGAPDCLIFGSSQAFREVHTAVFEQAYEAASGEKVTCYNFGVTGSQIWTTSLMSRILIQRYQPRLVVIGTSFLDYTEGREYEIDERFEQNDWLKYQRGEFTLNGWLMEHSYAWRAITLLSYAAPANMRLSAIQNEVKKWDGEIAESGYAMSDKSTDPNQPVDVTFVNSMRAEFGNFGISERHLSALEDIVTFSQQAGAQVLIVEMIYHPALLELKDGKGRPRADKERILAFIGSVNARLREIAARHNIHFLEFDPSLPIPETGWFDLYHLNIYGAEVFSQWLGERAAQALGPLPPARSASGGANQP